MLHCLFAFNFLTLFACREETQTTTAASIPVIGPWSGNEVKTAPIKNVDALIALLNTTSILEGKSPGFTGEPSTSYTHFQQLQEIADDSILLRLTYHDNPKMRVYGMWGLSIKNPALAEKQLDRFFNDPAELTYRNGCISMGLPIFEIATSEIDSNILAKHRSKMMKIKYGLSF